MHEFPLIAQCEQQVPVLRCLSARIQCQQQGLEMTKAVHFEWSPTSGKLFALSGGGDGEVCTSGNIVAIDLPENIKQDGRAKATLVYSFPTEFQCVYDYRSTFLVRKIL